MSTSVAQPAMYAGSRRSPFAGRNALKKAVKGWRKANRETSRTEKYLRRRDLLKSAMKVTKEEAKNTNDQIKRAVTLTRAANRGIDNLKSTVRVLEVMRGQFAAAAGSADKTFEDRFVEAL